LETVVCRGIVDDQDAKAGNALRHQAVHTLSQEVPILIARDRNIDADWCGAFDLSQYTLFHTPDSPTVDPEWNCRVGCLFAARAEKVVAASTKCQPSCFQFPPPCSASIINPRSRSRSAASAIVENSRFERSAISSS